MESLEVNESLLMLIKYGDYVERRRLHFICCASVLLDCELVAVGVSSCLELGLKSDLGLTLCVGACLLVGAADFL